MFYIPSELLFGRRKEGTRDSTHLGKNKKVFVKFTSNSAQTLFAKPFHGNKKARKATLKLSILFKSGTAITLQSSIGTDRQKTSAESGTREYFNSALNTFENVYKPCIRKFIFATQFS